MANKRTILAYVKEQSLSLAAQGMGNSKEPIIAGSKGYLDMRFHFDSSWDDVSTKIAVFKMLDVEEAVFLNRDRCDVPDSVTDYDRFTVFVIGANNDRTKRIITNRVTIEQKVDR